MASFTSALNWKPGSESATLSSGGKPDLPIATPPEFGGPQGLWSPEDALVGALQSCLLFTALYFVNRFKVQLKAYASEGTGTLQKTAAGLRFTTIAIRVRATVTTPEDVENMRRAMEQAEKFCPVSAAVSAPVTVTLEASVG